LNKCKEEVDILQREEIEKEKILSSLNLYINNNLKIEELKITSKDNMKSGKYGDIDTDISTLSLLNSFLNSK
jgi:hypothetical protein